MSTTRPKDYTLTDDRKALLKHMSNLNWDNYIIQKILNQKITKV